MLNTPFSDVENIVKIVHLKSDVIQQLSFNDIKIFDNVQEFYEET